MLTKLHPYTNYVYCGLLLHLHAVCLSKYTYIHEILLYFSSRSVGTSPFLMENVFEASSISAMLHNCLHHCFSSAQRRLETAMPYWELVNPKLFCISEKIKMTKNAGFCPLMNRVKGANK